MATNFRDTLLPVALSLCLLVSVLAPFAISGAFAQSDYSKTFDGTSQVDYVGIDTDGMSGDTFTVKISTTDGPGGNPVTLYEEEHTVAELQQGETAQVFENAGVYDDVTIEVLGASEKPTFGTARELGCIGCSWEDTFTSTGGDRAFTCGPAEKLGELVNPAAHFVDCNPLPGKNEVGDTSSLTDQETKLEIYKAGLSSKQSADGFNTVVKNRLNDAQTVALVKAKSKYVQELNNGSSESVAKAEAKSVIGDYYSQQELNIIKQWNRQLNTTERMNQTAANDTIDKNYVRSNVTKENPSAVDSLNPGNFDILGYGTETITLTNGTSVTARTVNAQASWTDNGNTDTYDAWIGIKDGATFPYADRALIRGIEVQTHDGTAPSRRIVRFNDYDGIMSDISSQAAATKSEMDTVSNNVYSSYQQGDINSSDLVDPYVLQNQYNPGSEFNAWSAATLASLGTNQPTNFSEVGHFNVTVHGGDGPTNYTGMLHAPENPPSGEFQTGVEYNNSKYGDGQFYLTTDDRILPIESNFTITDIQTKDGETQENITYVEKNYTTSDNEDLTKLYDQLNKLESELDAASADSGGGGTLFGGSGSGQAFAILGAVIIIMAMAGRDD